MMPFTLYKMQSYIGSGRYGEMGILPRHSHGGLTQCCARLVGIVGRAKHTISNQDVVVKQIRDVFRAGQGIVYAIRSLREIAIMMPLNHPNIIKLTPKSHDILVTDYSWASHANRGCVFHACTCDVRTPCANRGCGDS